MDPDFITDLLRYSTFRLIIGNIRSWSRLYTICCVIIMIFYCGLMVHITDKRAQKVVSYTSAHIAETVFAHDPTLGGAKQFILTTAVSSFAKSQKMDNHTVGHYTTGVSTCPALRRARHFPSTSYFFMLGVYTVSTYFYYTKAKLMRSKIRNISRTTTAFGLHNGVLNN